MICLRIADIAEEHRLGVYCDLNGAESYVYMVACYFHEGKSSPGRKLGSGRSGWIP